jgi:hypothetical protein
MAKKYTKRENEVIKYEVNPSVANLLLSDKPRKKFIREKTLTDEKVAAVVGVGVNDDFGELVKGSMFISSKKVDSETFVKVYAEGWKVLLDLSGTALKVFKFIYKQVLDNPKKDSIILHYTSLKARNLIEMSQPTFKSGLNELLNKNCLFSSYDPNIYFLNVQYFFNGERHYLIQEYRLDKQTELEQPDLLELE